MPSGLGPSYYNRVIQIESTHSAFKILSILQNIENIFGRKRTKYEEYTKNNGFRYYRL